PPAADRPLLTVEARLAVALLALPLHEDRADDAAGQCSIADVRRPRSVVVAHDAEIGQITPAAALLHLRNDQGVERGGGGSAHAALPDESVRRAHDVE